LYDLGVGCVNDVANFASVLPRQSSSSRILASRIAEADSIGTALFQ
jgi:hypothetical protein